MSLYLKRLTTLDGYDIYTMTQTMPKEENGFQNSAYGLSFEAFSAWLQRQHDISLVLTCPKALSLKPSIGCMMATSLSAPASCGLRSVMRC